MNTTPPVSQQTRYQLPLMSADDLQYLRQLIITDIQRLKGGPERDLVHRAYAVLGKIKLADHPPPNPLNAKNRRLILKIINGYQEHLESAIETSLVPGEHEPREPHLDNVAADRKRWDEVENLRMDLSKDTERRAEP